MGSSTSVYFVTLIALRCTIFGTLIALFNESGRLPVYPTGLDPLASRHNDVQQGAAWTESVNTHDATVRRCRLPLAGVEDHEAVPRLGRGEVGIWQWHRVHLAPKVIGKGPY